MPIHDIADWRLPIANLGDDGLVTFERVNRQSAIGNWQCYDFLAMRTYSLVLVILALLSALGARSEHANSYVRPAAQLYRRYCVSCHGTDGKAKTSKGKYSHARDLTEVEWQTDVSDERIFNSIMNGRNVRGNMPPFGQKLKEDEINSLISFIRRLKG